MFLMFLFLYPFIIFSLDENYFDSQVSQCICAVKPNECNPYCSCDPFCTNEQKSNFTFYLPETFSTNKIACDQKNRISKINLNSIKEELPNCYSIDGKENGKKIENYSPVDFGIDDFSKAIDSPFYQENFDIKNDTYSEKQLIIGSNLFTIQNIYIPIAVGSSVSNALIPFRFKMSLPNYSCIIHNENPISYITSIAFIENLTSPNGIDLITRYNFFSSLRSDVRRNKYRFLDIQYIFQMDEEELYIENISMKKIGDSRSIEDLPTEFLYFTSRVYFGPDSLSSSDTKYSSIDMGYYYGTPIMVEDGDANDLNSPPFGNDRRPLQVNSEDILFGVNTTIILPINKTNYDNQITPDCAKIYKSFGYIIMRNNFKYFISSKNINTTKDDKFRYPIAHWNFYYMKFNNESVPIYLLQHFNGTRHEPNNIEKCETLMIHINFYEIDHDAHLKVDEEIRFHSHSYSTLFDFLFRDTLESLETIGLLFCFGIIGTIWCWYVCFFYIED